MKTRYAALSDRVLYFLLTTKQSRKSRIASILLIVTWIAFVQLASLLSPVNKNNWCGPTLSFLNLLHIHVICDSYWYMMDAQTPSRLLEGGTSVAANNSLLQDRPAITFLAYLLSRLIEFFPGMHKGIAYSGQDGVTVTYQISTYAGFLIINTFVMSLTIVMCISIFRKTIIPDLNKRNILLYCLVSIVFLSLNEVTKVYFLMPNSALFNDFIPVYMIWLISKENDFLATRFQMKQSLILALATLMYPMFLICVPLWSYLSIRRKRKIGLITSAVSLSFYFLWPILIVKMGGHYLNWGSKGFSEFSWIKDAIQAGNLLPITYQKALSLFSSLPLVPTLALIVGALTLTIRSRTEANIPNGSFPVKLLTTT